MSSIAALRSAVGGTPTVAAVDAEGDSIVRDLLPVLSRLRPYENKVAALPAADQRGRWTEDIVLRVSAELMKGHAVDTTGMSGMLAYATICNSRRRVTFALDFPNEQA